MAANAGRHGTMVVLCMGFMLSACGGGGGGDSGGGGGGGGSSGNQGQFTISPASLTFSATSIESGALPPMTITGTVSGVSPQTLYINARVSGPAVSSVGNIAISGPTSGTAQVYPVAPMTLGGPGSYSSVITVTACTTSIACTSGIIGTPQTINVTYTIDGVTASPGRLNYQVGDTIASGDLVRTFDVTGYPAQDWVLPTSPWIAFDPPRGNTGATTRVTATLLPEVYDSYESGAHFLNFSLVPTRGVATYLGVTVDISRIRVDYVAPYVALAGTQNDVIIRGTNLRRYPITGVRFGGIDAVSYTVVNDTEIRARHPILTEGNYEVSLVNGQPARTRAALRVVAPDNYSSAVLDYPSSTVDAAVCLAHDPERDFLFVGVRDADSSQVLRYSLSGGGSVPTAVSVPNIGACALTTDGRRIVVATHEALVGNTNGMFAFSELDPTTLNSELNMPTRGSAMEAIAMAAANNGQLIFSTSLDSVQSYPQLRPGFRTFTPSYPVHAGNVAASRDGSVVLVGSANSGPLKYDASTDQLTRLTSPASAAAVDLDRTGERALFDHRHVYSRDFQLLGSLPQTTRAAALSPSGQRAYAYDQNGTVRTFNLTAVSGGAFTEVLPAITVGQRPGADATKLQILVSHDEQAVFIAGNERALVIPLP
ncbi:IPT/TIG domain-containing protein [Steroidobacter agaridevorans]|uniref:IPT/TIG domain-containing protein n=1 Tax=Steroidobacter agaridevorans TaxID=2695856 RepID=UPI001379B692|nr:IPT/TIG domain-containing protein [Steroidobacter agaridevorans]